MACNMEPKITLPIWVLAELIDIKEFDNRVIRLDELLIQWKGLL